MHLSSMLNLLNMEYAVHLSSPMRNNIKAGHTSEKYRESSEYNLHWEFGSVAVVDGCNSIPRIFIYVRDI